MRSVIRAVSIVSLPWLAACGASPEPSTERPAARAVPRAAVEAPVARTEPRAEPRTERRAVEPGQEVARAAPESAGSGPGAAVPSAEPSGQPLDATPLPPLTADDMRWVYEAMRQDIREDRMDRARARFQRVRPGLDVADGDPRRPLADDLLLLGGFVTTVQDRPATPGR